MIILIIALTIILFYGASSILHFMKLKNVQKNFEKILPLINQLNEDIELSENEVENMEFEAKLFYQYHINCFEENRSPSKTEILELINNRYDLLVSKIRTQINTLPVLGLVGTFLGVAIAITNLNLDPNLASSETIDILKSNLNELPAFLDGIRLAFYSSLVALTIAIIIRVILSKFFTNKAEIILRDINNKLLIDYLPRYSGTTSNEKIIKGVNNLSKSIKKYSDDFQNNITSIIHEFENWANSNSSSLVDIKKGIEASVDRFIENITNIDQIINQNKESLQKLSADYQLYLEEVTDFNESLAKLLNSNVNISNDISELGNKIDLNIEKVEKNIDKKLDKIGDLSNSFADQNAKLNSIIDSIKEIREKFEKDISQFFEELNKKNSSTLFEINQLRELLPQLIRKFERIEIIQDNSDLIYKRMEEIIKQLNEPLKNLNDSASNIYDASSHLVGNVNTKLEDLFNDLRKKDNLTINMVQIESNLVEKFNEINSLNKELMNNLKEEISTLQKTINNYSILKFLKLKRDGK